MKKGLVLAVIVALLCFTGCGENTPVKPESSNTTASTTVTTEPTAPPEAPALTAARQEIAAQGNAFGVIHIDTWGIEITDPYDASIAALKTGEAGERYPFLQDIPKERFVAVSEGSLIFAVIPADKEASVSVYPLTFDDALNNTLSSDAVYRGEAGEPILVKCCFSDLFPDAQINVTPKGGKTVSWQPLLSGRDSSVIVAEHVVDLTVYK